MYIKRVLVRNWIKINKIENNILFWNGRHIVIFYNFRKGKNIWIKNKWAKK